MLGKPNSLKNIILKLNNGKPLNNIPYENILLYNNGIKTTAVVYANARLRHGVNCSHYQFYISGTRYKGRSADLEIGDSIEVIYLPKNPRVNVSAKNIDYLWKKRIFVLLRIIELDFFSF